jgi:hypothetical protein
MSFSNRPFLVGGQQRIPVRTPEHLDHVPAGAAKIAFQLLNDLAVAAHRAVQPLQVAVDDENQIVQILAGGQRNRAQRFRLVHFAVAAEAPDFAAFGIGQAPVVQVLHEPGLIDGLNRAKTHRHGGKLPEIGHQPRMRIGRQAVAVHFLAEIVQLLFGQPPFQIGAGINAGRGMALNEHQIAAVLIIRRVPEVVEADIVQSGAGGETGDMAAQFGGDAVGLDHHRQRIPANQRTNPPFHAGIAGGVFLLIDRDGVDIRGIGAVGHVDAGGAGLDPAMRPAGHGRVASPSASSTASRASSHSCVSCGSRSLSLSKL